MSSTFSEQIREITSNTEEQPSLSSSSEHAYSDEDDTEKLLAREPKEKQKIPDLLLVDKSYTWDSGCSNIDTVSYGKTICENLTIDDAPVRNITFNPSSIPNLNVTTEGLFVVRATKITHYKFTGSETNKYYHINSFEITEQKKQQSYSGNLAQYRNYLGRPKCALVRVDIIFPPTNKTRPPSINVDGFKTIISEGLYRQTPINIEVFNGDVKVKNAQIDTMSISSKNGGSITGQFTVIESGLSLFADDGKIKLTAKIPRNGHKETIIANTESGDVELKFNQTFTGRFQLKSEHGKVHAWNVSENLTVADPEHEQAGIIRFNKQDISGEEEKKQKNQEMYSTVFVSTKNGDISVEF
ncbi:hypothetical protein G9A89_010192 [Geosiphon pyriformis]|nr:hypothetical protein G9A89_010192 [Geosiphon pyriformis]